MSGSIPPKVYTGMTVVPDGFHVALDQTIQNLNASNITATNANFGALVASSATFGTITYSTLTTTAVVSPGSLSFTVNGSLQAMNITTGGFVGIGTATPSSALQVVGTVGATTFSGGGSLLTGIPLNGLNTTGTPSAGNFLRGDGTWAVPASGSGTVTSVDVSGGATGMTFTGGPITTNGTVTMGGTLATTNGGTGLTGFGAANRAIYSTGTNTLAAGTLPVAAGGTGLTTIAANAVLVGNGTGAVTTVAPGASGNVLQSNGTIWTSSTPSSSTGFTNIQVVTSTGTIAAPASTVKVTIVGGGAGGSGGVDGTTYANGGAGGGGGATAIKTFTGLTGNLVITIGAGGTGGTSGGNGTAGGTSTIVTSGGTLTATGGSAATTITGGAGGTATGGTINLKGSPGFPAVFTLGIGGMGGCSFFNGSGAPGNPNVNSNGSAGQNYGAGGGGGSTLAGGGSSNGGAGAAGAVILEY